MLSEQSPFTETIFKTYNCTIYIISRSEGITHLSFSTSIHLLAVKKIQSTFHNEIIRKNHETNNPICNELKEYFAGQRQSFSLTLDPFFLNAASPLRQQIWHQISAIPYGKTITYGEIGRKLGNPELARIVGQAAKANPLMLLIPCHRVTGKYSIGGYSGGTPLKQHLLQLERSNRRDMLD